MENAYSFFFCFYYEYQLNESSVSTKRCSLMCKHAETRSPVLPINTNSTVTSCLVSLVSLLRFQPTVGKLKFVFFVLGCRGLSLLQTWLTSAAAAVATTDVL